MYLSLQSATKFCSGRSPIECPCVWAPSRPSRGARSGVPLLPVILGILAIAAAAFDQPWTYGIGVAMFFGWVIAAVFPLAG